MMIQLKKYVWCLILILFFWFGPASVSGGDYSAAFLEIGVGARALAMGGAFCSLANDGTAFYWNPAGLAFMRRPQISGMYGPQFGSLSNPLANFHYLGYTQPLPGGAVVSVNWMRLTV